MRSGVPRRSHERIYAESYVDYKNDVFIFIEDKNENTRKIMLEFIKRAFNKDVKIDRLHSLGGRKHVVNAFENRNEDRAELYIIDGDLNLLFEQSLFQKGLICLDRYCIENYLLDKEAISELLYEEATGHCDKEQLLEEFDYDNWYAKQDKLLIELFIEYALEKKNSLGIETVQYSVNQLRSRKKKNILCLIDEELVFERIKNLEKEIKEQIGEEQYLQDREKILSLLEDRKSDIVVSAKDYILPLVFDRLKKFAKNTRADAETLKYRLSKTCNIENFQVNLEPHVSSF